MTGDVVLMSAPRYRRRRVLPVLDVVWMPERRAACQPRVTQRGFRKGEPSLNAGKRYPATPPTKDEMVRLLAACPGGKTGVRLRALLVVLWRAGLRISEALDLQPHHIDYEACTVTIMSGKGGRHRVVGTDLWALEQIQDWYAMRATLPIPAGAPLFCCVSKGTVGNPINPAFARQAIKWLSRDAQIPHRMAPHQLRHALACDLAREGVPVHLIQRQLGHADLAMTTKYLQGIAPEEVVAVMSLRAAPAVEKIAPGVDRFPERIVVEAQPGLAA